VLTLTHRQSRRAHHTDLQRVVLLQSCVRRRQARNEYKALKQEAKSVSHFKEVSYKLENKVVELTQTLQKRTADNRNLSSKLNALEAQLASWQAKYEESEGKSKALQAEAEKPTVALPEFEALESAKRELEGKLSQSMKRMQDQECVALFVPSLPATELSGSQRTQIQRLTDDFQRQTEEMEKRQKLLNSVNANGASEDNSTVSTLRSELTNLREQLSRAVAVQNAARPAARGDASFQLNGGRGHTGAPTENGHTGTTGPFATPSKRKNRRTSVSGYPSDPIPDLPADFDPAFEPRAASMLPGGEGAFRAPGSTAYISNGNDEDPTEEIMRLLENEESLDEDVLVGLIQGLKLPAPSNQNPPAQKDVLFPAHLISLVTNEMWKYGYMRESERFLANVMQTVQGLVMVRPPAPLPLARVDSDDDAQAQQGEDAILPGIFWLSNIHEILSFVCIAESDILQGIGPGEDGAGRQFDWDECV
jgi:myosin-5